MPPGTSAALERRRLTITGVVQGVGFRPFVYCLANELGLAGFVGNNAGGVFVEIEGSAAACDLFIERLGAGLPPLAHIATLVSETLPPRQESGFTIHASDPQPSGAAWISPDIATCDACIAEMLDPRNRRFRYPFINCTNCGPRFTITLKTPYDRPSTTMAGFRMCPDCLREYESPSDRRFHAQPNACAACGPALSWTQTEPLEELRGDGALGRARTVLREGGIVAIKGIGGYHLVCDARNDAAVERLRERKHRYGKPLAVMVADVEAARALALVSEAEAALLSSRPRPILLLKARDLSALSSQIAPGTDELGIMLPYSGLHVLLMETMGPCVMTSGNMSQEPILWLDDQARAGLAGIADGFLTHDRPIHVPCDDSVLRCDGTAVAPLRRSRGYAPLPVALPRSGSPEPVLAVGAELKAAFCLTRNGDAFLSQHLGDMESYATQLAMERAVEHFTSILRVQPARVACDLHPGYFSTRWATQYAHQRGLPLIQVQHHHAHLAALMAEHHCDGTQPILGLIFDGSGYGLDGTIWGGEVLLGDYSSCRRLGHLQPLPLPGGEGAIRHPYRVALAALWQAGVPWDPLLPCVAAASAVEQRLLSRQLETGFSVARASSMGRLFDAAAAIIGLRRSVQFEAQAAIELETLADGFADAEPYECAVVPGKDGGHAIMIDTGNLIRGLAEDVLRRISPQLLSQRFHASAAAIATALAEHARASTGVGIIALSGGVWQNRLLTATVCDRLQSRNFHVLQHRVVPCNDGGLALGQAAIASLRRPGSP